MIKKPTQRSETLRVNKVGKPSAILVSDFPFLPENLKSHPAKNIVKYNRNMLANDKLDIVPIGQLRLANAKGDPKLG